jgi:hypothetical protein
MTSQHLYKVLQDTHTAANKVKGVSTIWKVLGLIVVARIVMVVTDSIEIMQANAGYIGATTVSKQPEAVDVGEETDRHTYNPREESSDIQEVSPLPSWPKRLFVCGYHLSLGVDSMLFPDFEKAGAYTGQNTTPNDIIFFGLHGPHCPIPRVQNKMLYIRENFRGKVLFLNGEPSGNAFQNFKNLKNWYNLGPCQGCAHYQNYTMQFYQMTQFFLGPSGVAVELMDHSKKANSLARHGANLINGVIYMNSHAVIFRNKAAGEISQILPVYHGKATPTNGNMTNVIRLREGEYPNHGTFQTQTHTEYLSQYKYCLSMENTNRDGYITEKILFAFRAGCLPIYYGTEEIFSIFNRKAFIYYDIRNPKPALDEIRFLQENPDAYRGKMAEPILAENGTQVIEELFSINDEFMGGWLKKRIRTWMGIDEVAKES